LSKVLEVGCGWGLNICTLALREYEVYGVDISKEHLNMAELLARKFELKSEFKIS